MIILALWGRALSSWRMALGPRFLRYGIATGSRISSLYLSALRLPSIMTRLVLPLREMPPHTITLPPLNDVTRSVQQSANLSPARLHTLILPSSFLRQNLDSSLQWILAKKNWSARHMFSIVSHSTNAGSLHHVPHCKGDRSMIKMVYNTIPFG